MDGSADGRCVIVLGSSDASPQAWKRKALGGFLLNLRADSLDEETALQICRDTGRTEDLVGRLLSGGRRKKALDAVASLPDRTLPPPCPHVCGALRRRGAVRSRPRPAPHRHRSPVHDLAPRPRRGARRPGTSPVSDASFGISAASTLPRRPRPPIRRRPQTSTKSA